MYGMDRESGGPSGLRINKTAALQKLGADVAGVDGAGDCGIFCAFEDGAAIGEDGHFIGRDAKAKQEIILADVSDGAREVRT